MDDDCSLAVIYHDNCTDGFAAAWAVEVGTKLASTSYIPANYSDPPPIERLVGEHVVIVDFSYLLADLVDIAAVAVSVLVLDHHKTARDALSSVRTAPGSAKDWWEEIERTKYVDARRKIACIFDMERSGAQIAWDFFHPNVPRPPVISYIGDQDLWRYSMPASKAVNAYINSFNRTFDNMSLLDAQVRWNTPNCINEGGAIMRQRARDLELLIKYGTGELRLQKAGLTVPCCAAPKHMASAVGQALAEASAIGIGATFADFPTRREYSLRSVPTGPDVSVIAQLYGGGGHQHAAGFNVVSSGGWCQD